MTASPWPPYLFFAPSVEFAAPRLLGARDWIRLKVLMSPSGGLDPDEARFWIMHREVRDENWHEAMDSTTRFMASHWQDLIEADQPLPSNLCRWTFRRAESLASRTAVDRLDKHFRNWSYSARLNW